MLLKPESIRLITNVETMFGDVFSLLKYHKYLFVPKAFENWPESSEKLPLPIAPTVTTDSLAARVQENQRFLFILSPKSDVTALTFASNVNSS